MKARRIAVLRPRRIQPVVWIIDLEQWPRALLRAELIERGYDAYGFMNISDALAAFSERKSPRPAAVVLELRGQDVTRRIIDEIRNMSAPVILLGGNTELNDPALNSEMAAVLPRPVSLGTIADTVEQILQRV